MRTEAPSTLRRRRWGHRPWIAAGCAAIAALSLTAPFAPGFDAWAWLVWGREVTELGLDTTAGPSWKPLTVLIAVPLTTAGDLGPDLWLWLTRTAWLLAAVLAASIAVRLTPARALAAVPGGAAAIGVVASVGVFLIDDPFTPWFRQGVTGLSEPLLVALALGAFLARLEGRGRLALALLLGCALLRPEAWVLLALLALERWQQGHDRAAIVAAGLLVPVLWFVPDLIGSGDPLTGAGRAREGSGSPPVEAAEVWLRLLGMPLAVLWPGALVAVVAARRRREPRALELALAAALWAAQVALLAAAGYAGLPRFMAPVAAAVCVLGASGTAIAIRWVRDRGRAPALAGIVATVALIAIGQAGWRGADLVGDVRGVSERAEREQALIALVSSPTVGARRRCGPLYLGEYLYGPAVAWRSRLRLDRVRPLPPSSPERGTAIVADAAQGSDPPLAEGRALARERGWLALGLGCRVPAGGERRSLPGDVVRVP